MYLFHCWSFLASYITCCILEIWLLQPETVRFDASCDWVRDTFIFDHIHVHSVWNRFFTPTLFAWSCVSWSFLFVISLRSMVFTQFLQPAIVSCLRSYILNLLERLQNHGPFHPVILMTIGIGAGILCMVPIAIVFFTFPAVFTLTYIIPVFLFVYYFNTGWYLCKMWMSINKMAWTLWVNDRTWDEMKMLETMSMLAFRIIAMDLETTQDNFVHILMVMSKTILRTYLHIQKTCLRILLQWILRSSLDPYLFYIRIFFIKSRYVCVFALKPSASVSARFHDIFPDL